MSGSSSSVKLLQEMSAVLTYTHPMRSSCVILSRSQTDTQSLDVALLYCHVNVSLKTGLSSAHLQSVRKVDRDPPGPLSIQRMQYGSHLRNRSILGRFAARTTVTCKVPSASDSSRSKVPETTCNDLARVRVQNGW